MRSVIYACYDNNLRGYQKDGTKNAKRMTALANEPVICFLEQGCHSLHTNAPRRQLSSSRDSAPLYKIESIPQPSPQHRTKMTKFDANSRVPSDFDADADGAPVPVTPLPEALTAVDVRFISAT